MPLEKDVEREFDEVAGKNDVIIITNRPDTTDAMKRTLSPFWCKFKIIMAVHDPECLIELYKMFAFKELINIRHQMVTNGRSIPQYSYKQQHLCWCQHL